MPALVFLHQVWCFWVAIWCLTFLKKIWCNLLSRSKCDVFDENLMWILKKDYRRKLNPLFSNRQTTLKMRWSPKKGLHLILQRKTFGREVIFSKKSLQPNFTSIHGCFCWRFAAKALYFGFDVIRCFFSKNLMYFKSPRWHHWAKFPLWIC